MNKSNMLHNVFLLSGPKHRLAKSTQLQLDHAEPNAEFLAVFSVEGAK